MIHNFYQSFPFVRRRGMSIQMCRKMGQLSAIVQIPTGKLVMNVHLNLHRGYMTTILGLPWSKGSGDPNQGFLKGWRGGKGGWGCQTRGRQTPNPHVGVGAPPPNTILVGGVRPVLNNFMNSFLSSQTFLAATYCCCP